MKSAASNITGAALRNAWMNTSPIICKNHWQDKGTKVKKSHKENSVRTIILIAFLSLSANFALAECTEYMQAFNKHQMVIKGMMDLNFQGKMNAEVGDAIGKRLQEAQKPLDAGDYNTACEMYDSILDDYGFDKSFGEAPDAEKKEAADGSSSDSETTAPASSASSEPAPASAESKPAD